MYAYLKGKVTELGPSYIVLEVNGIGYLINVANPFSFNVNENYTVYVYNLVREDEMSLYGFKLKEERELFLKLIEVKGLGCKMALPMFATGGVEGIIDAIERENILYLKKFPKIGDKVARQIILDLKGKLVSKDSLLGPTVNEELVDALKALGYKTAEINKVTPKLKSETLEDQIKEALKLLLR